MTSTSSEQSHQEKEISELLNNYRQFSPLENRDKPMITELEQKISSLNKQQIQHLASQLNTIHEQHRLYTKKTNDLDEGYNTARNLKKHINTAEHASLSRNKDYKDTQASSSNATRRANITAIISIILLVATIIVLAMLR